MIRLPPTSISLSANDLDFHLHQLNIYHGLLKQGFKKKDVLRYFEEQKESQRCKTVEQQQVDVNTPTTLELADRRLRSRGSVGNELPLQTTIRLVNKDRSTSNLLEDNESTEESEMVTTSPFFEVEYSEPDEAETMSETLRNLSLSSQTQNIEVLVQRSLSITTQNEPNQFRHAPRQSSLLRFARTVSSETSEAYGSSPFSGSLDDTGLCPATEEQDEQITYRKSPRLSKEVVVDDTLAPVVDKKLTSSRSYSSLDPEAREFTPLLQMPPFLAMQRISSGEPSLPSVTRLQDHVSSNTDLQSSPSSTSSDNTTRFRSSPPILEGSINFPSSPPRVPHPLPHLPTTPMSRYNAARTESEPRDRRQQDMDGSTFTVYDDSMPIGDQPQTPADLSRRPLMSRYNAAYTAPPGVIYGTGTHGTLHESMLELGEQSPTERAIELRSRRNREFARSARVEGLRILRARRRIYQGPSASLNDNDVAGQNGGRVMDFWREDLEADRVGEENFAEEAELMTRQLTDGLRVVSGNERPRMT